MRRPIRFRGARSAAVLLGITFLAMMASVALGQEKYEFRARLAEGQRWSFDNRSDLRMRADLVAPDQSTQKLDQRLQQRRKGTVRVLEVKDGQPAAIRVSFDPGCESSVETAGLPARKMPHPLAGQTVTLRRLEDGTVSNDFNGPLDPVTQQDLRELIEPDTGFYPQRPVAIGEEWNATPAALAKTCQLGPRDSGLMRCRLVSVKDVGGRRMAEIALTVSLTRTQGPVQMQADLRGTGLLEMDSGRMTQGDLAGTLSMTGTQHLPQPDGRLTALQFTGEGQSEFHGSAKPADEAYAGLPPAAASPLVQPQPPDSPAGK